MSWEQHYLAVMAAVIERYGHAVQYVVDDTGTGRSSFAHTVGLHAHPGRGYELAVSGLPPELAVGLLNDLAAALDASHHVPGEGLDVHDLLRDGLALRLRKVSRPEDLTIVRALYAATPPAWQALWPDSDGHYPGDPGYALPDSAQRLL